ncbi:MAG: Smr/MutS family protein [Bacilli bacterium]|jgi:DNA mismatch repair protein MutS2
MEENYLYLETDEVIKELKGFFSLEGLKKSFSIENDLAKDKNEVELSHQYLKEFSQFLHDGHEINIPSLLDMDTIFGELDKGMTLSAAELFSIADLLSCSGYLYDLLYDKKEYYHLNDDALDLNPVEQLKRDLISSIEPDLTVSDSASPKLREIRVEKRGLERNLSNIMNTYKNRYSSYLSNDVITFKGGEEALPIKASSKGFVKGSVVAYSGTGETVFMVPYEVIDLRNKLTNVLQEEGSEIIKVLADLSQKASKQLKFLTRDYEIIFNFDRYLSSVRFGNSYFGSISELSDKEFTLKSLFHPLLKATPVITNSLFLGNENPKALLITGPNAGGKSVFIKAVALSVMMDKLGLMVPCKGGATIPFMDNVYFLGGDNQSVMDNLSTFSSHIIGIKGITDKATKDSLVIIDEVGEGTSPKDGEALGVALLKYFERLGSYTLLTSHFDGLKIYAASDDKALTGAMEFNTGSLKPTYRLLLHTTGKSYGLLLAKNLGIKPEIIADAQNFEASRANQDTDALMEKLTEQESINEKKQRELDNRRKDLEALIDKRQKAIDALNEEKASIHVKAEDKINRLVDARIADINKVWDSKSTKATYSDVSKAKGELNKMKTIEEPTLVGKETPDLTDLKAGDLVEDEDYRRATVLEVKKNEVLLDLDGLRFKRPIHGLTHARLTVKDIKKNKASNYTSSDTAFVQLSNAGGLELNIIGLHVDEAMRKVVSYIGNSRIRKLSMIRIIHGTGSFALKNAVWKYLANHPAFIKDYRLGGEGEGGLGATVVHLK